MIRVIRAIRGNKVIAVLRVLHFGCLKPKKVISITEIIHKSLIAVNDLCIFFAVTISFLKFVAEFIQKHMETLYNKHRILISQTNLDIIREVMHTISWDRQL